jgi:hypothetical protein
MIAALAVGSGVFLVIVVVGSWLTWKRCRTKNGCRGKPSEESRNLESLRLAEIDLFNWDTLAVGKRGD